MTGVLRLVLPEPPLLAAGRGSKTMPGKTLIFLLMISPGVASAQMSPNMPMPRLSTAITIAPVSIDRKLQILKSAGIDVVPAALQEAVTLSVRKPWVDAETYLTVTRSPGYDAGANIAAIGGASGGLNRSYVTLYWRANPARRHIVDCAITNSSREPISFDWALGSARSSATAAITGGRAAVVMPAGSRGDLALASANAFTFTSCEITPVG